LKQAGLLKLNREYVIIVAIKSSIMARIKEREKAIQLRNQGWTYSQIKAELNIAKSTLSNWLSAHPLSEGARRRIESSKQRRIETYIATRKRNKKILLENIYKKQLARIGLLSERDIFIAGLFLYWGEGSKFKTRYELRVTNSDPAIINAHIQWLIKSLKIEKEKISLKLYLYRGMNIENETDWWAKATGIPKNQFKNPAIKYSNPQRVTHKGSHGHGTCNAIVNNANLGKQVAMSLNVLKDYFMRL